MQEQAEPDEEWHAQLLQAAKNGDDDALQSLSSIPDINLEDKDGHRAVDYAWERKHFMFVLSLLKRDSAFPLGFHLELESDKAAWKDLKRFVEKRNRLHNFVKDGSYGQVKTNCLSIKSKYFLNSKNQSLLYTAIKHKKFEIMDFLVSNGVEFLNQNEKCAVDELIQKNVSDNLNDFVKYFVKEFEAKLHAYYLILEGEIKKAGKFSDTFSERIGQGVGAAAGGLIGCFVSTLTAGVDGGKLGIAGAKLGGEGAKEITGKVESAIGNDQHRKKAITLHDLIDCAENDKANFRRKLVEDAVDIFQSFEMQFMRVSTDQGPKQAMQLLARDATNRIINYYGGNKDVNNLIEGVVSGSSKIEPVWGVPIVTSKIKNPGFTIYYGSYKEKWLTASLYKKVGLVREETYYEKKDGKSRVGKYGYRRLFKSEDWDKLKPFWNELDPSDERYRFKNYKHVLNQPYSRIPTLITTVLEYINLNDENLMEERIKELLKENKKDIMEAINTLKKQSHGFAEDRRILTNLENNLKNLKVDEYFKKFKQHFKSTKGPVWFNVRKPVQSFIGRKKDLAVLHSKINPENPTAISQMLSISGLGGIGKTELARQYIKEHGKDFDNVIWINSESEATLNDSFRRLAYNKLKIEMKDPHGKEKSMKDVVEDVHTFFSKSKTLFIFDNAEENDDFKNYLPLAYLTPDSKNPYILITSRNREWKKIEKIEIIHLNELTLEDAVDLIKEELQIKNENLKQEIEALAEKLQRFPLAIRQAIAYIVDQRVTGEYSSSYYLQEYEKKTQDLLDSEKFKNFTNDYEKTTFTTWKITIDRIVSDKEHGELASDILNALAYLAPDNINREMFLVLAKGDETKLKSAVRLLVKYSMINGEPKEAVLNIHRLVQAMTRLQLKSQNKEEKILKDVFELLGKNFPYYDEKLDDSAKIRQYLPHLEAFTSHIDQWIKQNPQNKKNIEKEFLEKLFIWMSYGYKDLGNPKKQDLLEKVLAIQEKHYGSDHFKLAETIANLGTAYGDLGDPQKQKDLLERALAIKEKHYGSDHFEVAGTIVNLSNAYSKLGNPQKQKDLLEMALAIKEKHYGSDHFEVARIIVNLSNAYSKLGDLQKQKDLLERALAIQLKHYVSDHLEVARTIVNLSNAYSKLGDPRKQKELLERALGIKEQHYGSDHFEVARTMVHLSNAYSKLGDPQKQKELLERALAIQEKHYGSDHFEVARTIVNLGTAYGDLGDPQKKTDLLERALAIEEKHYGSDHFEVARTIVNLGTAYGDLSDPQKKKELLERALAIQEKHYGSDYFEVARTIENLGNAYSKLGDPQKQKDLLERALAINEKHYGPDHFEVARTIVNLGTAYSDLGDPQKKKELLERAIAIQEKHYGSDHLQVARTMVNLSNAYSKLGDPQKKKELLERAIAIQEKHYGSDHFEVARTMVNLSNAYSKLGDPQKQKELLERALVIQRKHYRPNHFELFRTMVNLSNAYGKLGDPQSQKDFLEIALLILELRDL